MSPVNDVPKFDKNDILKTQDLENQMRKMISAELIKKIQARIDSGDENFMKALKMVINDETEQKTKKQEK